MTLDMSGMDLPGPLTWDRLFSTWSLHSGWLLAAVVMMAGYQLCWQPARRHGTHVRAWRAACFHAGTLLMWASIASGIGAYAMSLFWVHMVLHLILIMVVPGLLVLGHPWTVLVGTAGGEKSWLGRALRSRPVGLITHPITGVAVYAVVIIYTHLTGFMDRMAMNMTLMTTEEVVYVVAGYLLFLPLLGEEPIRFRTPYLVRLVAFLIAMVPDTLVGVVLLQSTTNPYPMMMSMHPAWAPNAVHDVHIAGGLMWAVGDGLMMIVSVGLMISVITSPSRQTYMTGAWLDSIRAGAITHGGRDGDVAVVADPDSDEALEAYNAMLTRMATQDDPGH